jgi:hypothetical protein
MRGLKDLNTLAVGFYRPPENAFDTFITVERVDALTAGASIAELNARDYSLHETIR